MTKPEKRSSRDTHVADVFKWIPIVVGYLALFLALDHVTSIFQTSAGVSPWYPPPGLTMAFLIILGPAFAPVAFVTVLISGLWVSHIDMSLPLLALLALIITAGYSLAAYLLRRVLRVDHRLQWPRSVGWFVAVTFLASGAVAVSAVASLTAAGKVPRSGYLSAVLDFWIGDAIGIVTLTPFLLTCGIPWIGRLIRRPFALQSYVGDLKRHLRGVEDILELVAQIASVALVLWIVFGSVVADQFHLLYFCFLPLLWIAVRHGLPRATAGILVINVGATFAARYTGFTMNDAAELQALLLILSLSGLFTGAVVTQRRRSKKDVYALLDATTETSFLMAPDGTVLIANETAARRQDGKVADFVGTNAYDWLPPDVAERRRTQAEHVIQSGDPVRFEDRRGDRVFDNSVYPILDEQGNVTKLAIFARDLTEQRQAMEDLSVANRFFEITNRHESMRPLLDEIVSEVKELTGCDAVGIRILDEERCIPYESYDGFSRQFYASENMLSIEAHHCMCIDVVRGETDPSLPFFTAGGSFYINGTSRFLATVPEEEKGQTRNVCNEYGYESVALIPIRVEDRILGLIHVVDRREDRLPLRTVQQLERAARHLGVDLRRVQAEDELWQRNRELSLLVRIGGMLGSTLDLDEVLEMLLEETLDLLGAVACSVWLVDPETDELVCRQATGPQKEKVHGWRLSPGEGLAGWSVHHGVSLIIADAAADDRHFSGVDRRTGLELRSILTVPLETKEGIIGVLQATDTAVDQFETSDLELLEPVGASAAVAIENARLYTQAQQEVARRRQAERSLRESEERFRLLYEDAPLGYQSLNAEGCLLDVNRAWLDLFGYAEKEQVVGQWFGAFIAPEHQEAFGSCFDHAKATGEIHNVELEALRDDGSRMILSFDGNVTYDQRGHFNGCHCILTDVTERRRLEEAYRTVVEYSLQGLAIIKEDRVAFANPAVAELTGYAIPRLQAFSSDDLKALIHPEDRDRIWNIPQQVLAGERTPGREEFRIVRKDGEIRWVETLANLVTHEGEPAAQVALVDITERWQAEEALRESERRHRASERIAHLGSWEMDIATGKSTWSDEFFRICGYEPGSIDPHSESGFSIIHPDDREEATQALENTLKTGEPYDIVKRVVRPDGTSRWVHSIGEVNYDDQGKPATLVGSCLDITERKRAEEAVQKSERKFRTLVENVVDWVWRVGRKGTYTYVSPQAEQMMGYPVSEILGKTPFHFMAPREAERVAPIVSEIVAKRERIVGLEDTLLAKDGREIIFETNATPLFDDNGAFIGYMGTCRDITERKRAEEALQHQAEELNVLQSTVLDITARHELPALLETIVQRAALLLGASSGGLYLCDPEREEVRCVVSYNTGRDYTGTVLSYGEGAAGVVAQTEEALLIDDYRIWSGRAAVYEEDQPFAAVLSAPMVWEGEVTGVIHVLHKEEYQHFVESDLELLTLFANHAAIAVENARLYEELRAERERLQVLSQRVVETQELERRRIARELHDEVGQALTAVKLNLQMAEGLVEDPGHKDQLSHSIQTVERTLQAVRDLSLDLRPSLLDDLGLVPALRWYVDRQAQQASFSAGFQAPPLEERLDPELEIACFRIVQEALTNATRHAQAQHVRVELRKSDDVLEILVHDDGVGFDVHRALDDANGGRSLGLLSMQERARVAGGEIEIESVPGKNTEIKARFPLDGLKASPSGRVE